MTTFFSSRNSRDEFGSSYSLLLPATSSSSSTSDSSHETPEVPASSPTNSTPGSAPSASVTASQASSSTSPASFETSSSASTSASTSSTSRSPLFVAFTSPRASSIELVHLRLFYTVCLCASFLFFSLQQEAIGIVILSLLLSFSLLFSFRLLYLARYYPSALIDREQSREREEIQLLGFSRNHLTSAFSYAISASSSSSAPSSSGGANRGGVGSVFGTLSTGANTIIERINPTHVRLALLDRDFTPEDYEMLLTLDEEARSQQQIGLTQASIERFPSYVVEKKKSLSSASNDQHEDICSICLEPRTIGNIVRTLPCLHTFHAECIDPWLLKSPLCPICKARVSKNFVVLSILLSSCLISSLPALSFDLSSFSSLLLTDG